MATVKNQRFGIEIETTGRTRRAVAEAIREVVGGAVAHVAQPTCFDPWVVRADDQRVWTVVADSSLSHADKAKQAEIVSPILSYRDVPTLQRVVRAVRAAGCRADGRCGIHVHVDATPHTPRSLCNLIKVVHANERHLVEALGVRRDRRQMYAKDIDQRLVDALCRKAPRTMEQLSRAWYGGRQPMPGKFDRTRYHAVNLHSVFHRGTIEFRYFDGTLHAGKVRAYLTLTLAVSAYAMSVRHVRAARRTYDGATTKYDFRVFLLRLGLIGEEFKNVRMHLLTRLKGSAAWRRAA